MRGPTAFFTFCLTKATQNTLAPGDLPTMLSVSYRTSGRDPLLVCACANVWSWHALSHAQLLNMLTFHEFFSAVSTSEPRHPHTTIHWHLWYAGWVQHAVPSGKYWNRPVCESGKSVSQSVSGYPPRFSFKPRCFFCLKFLGVHQLLSEFSQVLRAVNNSCTLLVPALSVTWTQSLKFFFKS